MKNRNLRSMLISVGVIVLALVIVLGGGYLVIQNLIHNGIVTENDVNSTVTLAGKYFIPLGVLIGLIILALIVFWNKSRKFNFWLKWESFIVFLVALILTLNTVVFGPMQALMNMNMIQINKVSAKTVQKGADLTEAIADEGTILLKNDGNFLPMKDIKKINVFGWASTQPLYGGTGSGQSNSADAVNIYDSLKQAGFQTNRDLNKFYTKYRADRPVVGMMEQDWTLPEPKVSQYSNKLMQKAETFSDTALVVIGRSGGEGADLPKDMTNLPQGASYKGNKGDFKKGQSYLELSQSEKNMLNMVNKNFKNVVVLINSSNPMELGFLNEYSHIKGAIMMAGAGTRGFKALGKVLNGTVNPSGRTVDTYVYDLKKTPTYNNFGNFTYANQKGTAFVNYVEGIYTGYKFYETYYQGKDDQYQKAVQYPFGYGLSYTKFSQEMSDVKVDMQKDKVSFNVTVKNTGDVAGKDVVQAYFTAPYTNGGLEKSATNLLDFKKTKVLKPGESQTLKFTANRSDFASYDESNGGAYVLDKGQYQIQIKNNAHDVLASKDFDVNDKVTYTGSNKRASDKVTATNRFQYAKGDITYLSRRDNFANYDEATKAPGKTNLAAKYQKNATTVTNRNYGKEPKATGKMPKQGQRGNLQLADLRGKSYDDPAWDKLLNQMTAKDMSNLIAYGGYQTYAINSVKKLGTYDFDGPAGYSSFFVTDLNTTAFPAEAMIAATFNTDLAKKMGELMGEQGREMGVYGWYGPAMNIHRSAFAGRNFEYYSEDPELSGKMAASAIAGAKSKGVYAYMKHFAMNDQETNRMVGLMTWSNEQAIREIYLKPFEMAVKDGGATAVMSSFNFIGNRWAGANKQLLQDVLRGEWGFRGLVETDYFSGGFMKSNPAIANGNDLMLSTTGTLGAKVDYTDNPTVVRQMRTASKNIMYTVVNSGAYKNIKNVKSVKRPYQKTITTYVVIALVVVAILQVLVVLLYRKRYANK